MGGLDKASTRLDNFFYTDGKPTVTKAGPLHAELDNEPSIETPWLYDFARQPWKTQQLVRQVLDTIWKNAPDGIPGNDDLGEMSSWAVFASMGMYPEIPGRGELVLGSPLFTSIKLHRPGGDVTIVRTGAGLESPYVHAVKLNGKALSKTWLPESFAEHGGNVQFEMSPNADKTWGTGASDVPPSFAVKP
jgi:putative alpha-1,2-mannosidase